MKQDPRELINDVHERVADDQNEHKILSGYTENPTVWGVSKIQLAIMLAPAAVMFRVAAMRLTGNTQLYGFAASVALAGLGLLGVVATPDDLEVQDYLTAVVSKHAYQQEMIHDTDPDESQLEQPTNDSLLGRFARLPFVRDWPILGAGDYEPTQALIPHEKPFRGEYAIQRDDGSLIAGIRVSAIPLRLESTGAKEKVERAVANALEGTVDYSAQWISVTREPDFEHRRAQWKDRARAYQSHADRLISADGDDTAIDAIRKQILADIADERAAGINLDANANRIREHYVLVSVDPGEAVIDRSSETGGLGSVPVFRWGVEKYRLWQQSGSEEHISTLIQKLEDRADNLTAELNRIDGLDPTTLPADEFSEVIADYYRGTNVRAHQEFTQAIRGSPVPGSEEAGDPEHDVGYQHITDRDRAGSPASPSPSPSSPTIHATADGGAVSADETGGTETADAPATEQQTESDTQ